MTLRATMTLVGLAMAATWGFTGCGVDMADEAERSAQLAGEPDVPPVYLDQGWSPALRNAWYSTTQGSRMLPYSWFIHLEEATSRQKFKAPSNMRRMGFLVDTDNAANPDNLPVGFAKDSHPTRGDAIGLTCAACHTGEVHYGGKAIRIDGGQGLGDLEQLQNGLRDALSATLADDAKFKRFADDVLGKDAGEAARATLRAQVTAKRDWWSARITRSKGVSPHGPSRTDAFTIIGNEVVCDMFERAATTPEAKAKAAANCTPNGANAPTQFPFLWGTPDFDWAQYNSSVHSPIGRNVGEVTGVFAEAAVVPAPGPAGLTVASTANLHNLHKLEGWVKTLKAPKWPADVLGAINEDAAAVGAGIYASKCASCHTLDPQPTVTNIYGRTMTKVNFSTPLSALGTDPLAAVSFATRRADPGPFFGIAYVNGQIGPDGKASVAALLSISGTLITQTFFAMNGFTDLQKLNYADFRTSQTPSIPQLLTYKARPLHGIALTAPYLHNGSVPTLYDLLLPPAERPKTFHVGNLEYDPVRVGYRTEKVANSQLLDTTKVGNSNGGHVYGTDLNDGQRFALIEYLKTL